ncbi:hypothetical protein [Enterobacter hormaechei]|uniref:hypothetical protein n=1 Tax=Enterobacter hormaechei TaxID=158836 RepID=UPI0034DD3A53
MNKTIMGLCLIALSGLANAHMTNYTCVKNGSVKVPMQTSMAQGDWAIDIDGKSASIDTQYATPTKNLKGGEVYHNDGEGGGNLNIYWDKTKPDDHFIEYQKPEHEFSEQVSDDVYYCTKNAGEW